MAMHHGTLRASTLAGVLALACFSASCTDPVKDAAIERLGDETGAGPGPEHRPGQPCVLCHSDGGPASDHKFAIGGTVFQSSSPQSKGAGGVRVLFIDASSAQRETETNAVGNFYITVDEWPDLTFPFKVGLLANNTPIPMTTTVNREGSCNFCHRPNEGSPLALPDEDPRESIGQIYVGAAP
jgi:hypothetical protein